MSTAAQLSANQANAQYSTGPKTETGKAASSLNNSKFGLTGNCFRVLPNEDPAQYEALLAAFTAEYVPASFTEEVLINKMAHHWLSQRAQFLQDAAIHTEADGLTLDRSFSLFLRYQTTHERAFHKCLSQLLKLRAEKRKEQIGFESQACKQAEENRRQEAHEAKVRLQNSKAEWQELNTELKGSLEAILPGHTAISFADLKPFLKAAIQDFVGYQTAKAA